jgi:hypothetical protein
MDHFILTFCQQWTHLYALPPIDFTSSSGASIVALDPIAKHRWAYRIDTLKLLPQRVHPLAAQSRRHPFTPRPLPICILLRFDSWFPWPVNILHQFILPPNPAFDSAAYTRCVPGSTPPAELPYLYSAGSSPLKPYIVDSIPSPIRIFTPADMTVGPYGTALWLDAQTDGAPSQAGDRGQRIAGKVLRFLPRPSEEGAPPRHPVDLQAQIMDGETTTEQEVVANKASDEEPRHVMLFHLKEDSEQWGRLEVSDDEGKLAVSCVDGRILVYDYT